MGAFCTEDDGKGDRITLAANKLAAQEGKLPGLCGAHYMGVCNRDMCPLMHGVGDSRFQMRPASGVVIPLPGSVYPWTDGTASIVLDDRIDPEYIPTDGEVADYAKWMGMNITCDGPFEWIAREGLKAPVPSPWRSCKTNNDEIYFFNFCTGTSSWDHPLDDHLKSLYTELRDQNQFRLKEARSFLLLWRRLEGNTFPGLLKYLTTFICLEPYPLKHKRVTKK